jgi:hypothetical protein
MKKLFMLFAAVMFAASVSAQAFTWENCTNGVISASIQNVQIDYSFGWLNADIYCSGGSAAWIAAEYGDYEGVPVWMYIPNTSVEPVYLGNLNFKYDEDWNIIGVDDTNIDGMLDLLAFRPPYLVESLWKLGIYQFDPRYVLMKVAIGAKSFTDM